MGIRFPGVFNKESQKAITHKEQSQHRTPGSDPFPEEPKDDEKDDPFKEGLIKLGRMTELVTRRRGGEQHTDGTGGDPAIELAVDEIPKAPESFAKQTTFFRFFLEAKLLKSSPKRPVRLKVKKQARIGVILDKFRSKKQKEYVAFRGNTLLPEDELIEKLLTDGDRITLSSLNDAEEIRVKIEFTS